MSVGLLLWFYGWCAIFRYVFSESRYSQQVTIKDSLSLSTTTFAGSSDYPSCLVESNHRSSKVVYLSWILTCNFDLQLGAHGIPWEMRVQLDNLWRSSTTKRFWFWLLTFYWLQQKLILTQLQADFRRHYDMACWQKNGFTPEIARSMTQKDNLQQN